MKPIGSRRHERPAGRIRSLITRPRSRAGAAPRARGALCALAAALAALLFAAPARGQETHRLSLEESVELGLERYPDLLAAAADVDAAEAAKARARAARLPTLRGAARYTRVGGAVSDVEIPLPDLDETAFSIPRNQVQTEARIEQVLFSAPRRHRIEAAEHRAEATENDDAAARADVAYAVRRAYWELYRAIGLRDAARAALARVEQHEREVRALVEEGAAVPSELLQAQTRSAEVRLELVEAKNAVRVGELELGQILGLPPGTRVEPTTDIEIEPPSPAPENLEPPRLAPIAAHPELRALRQQRRALEAEADAAASGWLPEISVFGRALYARPNPYLITFQQEFRGSYELGAALDWRIWEGGARRSEAREARARTRAAEARLESARLELAADRMRRLLEVQRAAEAAEVAEENVEAAGESLRVTRALFREGVATSAAVLDAEAAQRQARAEFANARADYAIARAALRRARGEVE